MGIYLDSTQTKRDVYLRIVLGQTDKLNKNSLLQIR